MQGVKSWMINTIQLCILKERVVSTTHTELQENQKHWNNNVARRAGKFMTSELQIRIILQT